MSEIDIQGSIIKQTSPNKKRPFNGFDHTPGELRNLLAKNKEAKKQKQDSLKPKPLIITKSTAGGPNDLNTYDKKPKEFVIDPFKSEAIAKAAK